MIRHDRRGDLSLYNSEEEHERFFSHYMALFGLVPYRPVPGTCAVGGCSGRILVCVQGCRRVYAMDFQLQPCAHGGSGVACAGEVAVVGPDCASPKPLSLMRGLCSTVFFPGTFGVYGTVDSRLGRPREAPVVQDAVGMCARVSLPTLPEYIPLPKEAIVLR